MYGNILAACHKKKYNPLLFKSLNNEYITAGVHAIEWGLNNEDAALSFLQKTENVVIQKTELWLHKCGYLGASPDGLIGENDVVEVKCPYKFRNSLLSEEISKDKAYIIYKEHNKIHVNNKHNYWHQVQAQLYFTRRQKCIFVVWTPRESIIVNIFKDNQWQNKIEILQKFYFEQYIPYIISNKII